MADVTITLRDTPEGGVVAYSTFRPALGQRLTPAQSLGLDLTTQASHRAEVVHMHVAPPASAAAADDYSAEDALISTALAHHPDQLPLELPQ